MIPMRRLRLQAIIQSTLDRQTGERGEIAYDRESNTLRIYNGTQTGGEKVALESYVDNAIENIDVTVDWTEILGKPSFAIVATSGNYNDLSNTPDIPGSILDFGIEDGSPGQVLTTDGLGEFFFSDVASSVAALSDVELTDLQVNNILKWNGFNWVNSTVGETANTTYSISTTESILGPGTGANLVLSGSDSSTDNILFEAGANISIVRTDANKVTISAAVGSLSINDLSDVDTNSVAPTSGQVLKWNGINWAPADDATSGGAGLNADTLDGFDGSYYLNYTNLSNTPFIPNDLLDLGITDGSNGQFLRTNGAGSFSFATITIPTVPTTILDLGISDGTAGQVLTTNGSGGFSFQDQSGGGGPIGLFEFTNSTIDTSTGDDITIIPNVSIDGNLEVFGQLSTITATSPEIVSDTTLAITATTRVEITSSPFKVASFTTTARNLLTAQNGDIIYNTTTNKFQGYQNGTWINLDGTV